MCVIVLASMLVWVGTWMQKWKYLHLVHIYVYEHVFIFVHCLDFCIICKGMRITYVFICEVCACVYMCITVLECMHVFMWLCVWLCRVVPWTRVNAWDEFVFIYEILHVLCRRVNFCVYVWTCINGCVLYCVLWACVLVPRCICVSMCTGVWCIHCSVSICVHSNFCVHTKPPSPSVKEACRLLPPPQELWD